MTMEIPELDAKGYRKFGITTGIIFAVLFGLLLPWLFNFVLPVWPWVLATVLIVWALVFPATLKPVYKVWMKFGLIMNWINTRLILGLLFYGIFLPFGIAFKLLGKDPMRRKLSKSLPSYRQPGRNEAKENVEHPY